MHIRNSRSMRSRNSRSAAALQPRNGRDSGAFAIPQLPKPRSPATPEASQPCDSRPYRRRNTSFTLSLCSSPRTSPRSVLRTRITLLRAEKSAASRTVTV